MLAASETERAPNQIMHACLDQRRGPRRRDRLGQPFETVTDHDADVFDAPVPDLGQHLQPGLGSLTTRGRVGGSAVPPSRRRSDQ